MGSSHHRPIANADPFFFLQQVGVVVFGGFSWQHAEVSKSEGEFEQIWLAGQ